MKRILTFALSLLLVLGLAPHGFAEETESCTISADSIQTLPDKTIRVPVRITGNPGFTNFAVSLAYEPDALELVSIDMGETETPYLYSAKIDWKNHQGSSSGYLTAASAVPVSEDGILYTATFHVSGQLTGTAQIVPTVHYIRSNARNFAVFEEIPVTAVRGVVTAIVAGDVNGDGLVEYDDVMLAYQASLDPEVQLTEEQMLVTDLNNSGAVDPEDVAAIYYNIYTGGN